MIPLPGSEKPPANPVAPFAVGDVVDYRDSDQAEAPGTYRGTITGPLVAGARWHVDLDNGGEEVAAPHELTLVRRKDDDEAPDCTRCGHYAESHEGGVGTCLAKDDGAYACRCFTYTADPNPGKDPNAPDDLQQDPAHRTPRLDLSGGGILPPVLAAGEDLQAGDPVHLAPEFDVVNHPAHYTSHPSGIECIQITEHMSFNIGNVIKYLWRADEKGAPIEDLEKASWYLNREIKRRKNM